MKRRDWLIFLVMLAAGGAIWLLGGRAALPAGEAPMLRVTVEGRPAELVALNTSRELVIEQEDGARNVVELFPGGFRMREASCRNQDCVHQGEVTTENLESRPLYNQVVCLPNRVVLELVTDGAQTLEVER